MADRSDRQHWGEGDVKYTPSQCSDCTSNKNFGKCDIYEQKPTKYQFGSEVCPSKTVSE